ncbi:hypothetical protein B9Z55_025146 [Caenorhabditis nigoni]|uniref:Uncharacterized protein n=1 Tax=Caenorhabditis nigoni TaxID=1611254 RepID=A0A2G5SX38_9PELO|nr:hypothetical protein B9Z55_025146 [Caenorhabditis nigoni]
MVESVDEMNGPIAANAEPPVIHRANPVPRHISNQKSSYYGGIPTRVIRSCKMSPADSMECFSTCSSLYSSDSEEEIVIKRPRIIRKNAGVNTDAPVVAPALEPFVTGGVINVVPQLDLKATSYLQPIVSEGVIRVVPLRPVFTVQLIPYQKHKEFDKKAPEFPTPIEEYHGIPVDLTNVQPPQIETQEQLRIQQMRKCRLFEYLTEEQYRIVWHSVRADGEEPNVKYSVPFTTDKSNFLANGDFTTVPAETWAKTLEYAMQRSENIRDLRRTIIRNVPPRNDRSARRNAMRRYRNDNRIRRRFPHIISTYDLD